MSAHSSRRVVTGLDGEGKSCILIDGPVARLGPTTGLAWFTEAVPADNSGHTDSAGQPFSMAMLQDGGTTFLVAEHAAGAGREPYWHAIDAIAYVVVLKGEMVLALETGEVRVKTGDCIVNRGVIHDWRNDAPEAAVIAVVTIPAHPVGAGRTV